MDDEMRQKFHEDLLKIAVDHPGWRPFLCQGHPFAAQVFIITRNPKNPTLNNWWDYWDPMTGFDFRRFESDKRAKQEDETPTYRRIRRFIEGLGTDVDWLITTLYPAATEKDDVTDGGVKHLELLFDYCKPGDIVVCSVEVWRTFFKPRVRQEVDIQRNKFTKTRWHSSNLYVTWSPHLGPGDDEFYRLGRKICETMGKDQIVQAILKEANTVYQEKKQKGYGKKQAFQDSISVDFPKEILTAVREDREQFIRQAMIYTLGRFYEQGKLSSGLGAKILGCDRWEFYRLLSENGFAVIDYPADELEAESLSSRQLADYLKAE